MRFTPAGVIAGAQIKTYLLEKSRITDNGGHERNFHFFYNVRVAGVACAFLVTITATSA